MMCRILNSDECCETELHCSKYLKCLIKSMILCCAIILPMLCCSLIGKNDSLFYETDGQSEMTLSSNHIAHDLSGQYMKSVPISIEGTSLLDALRHIQQFDLKPGAQVPLAPQKVVINECTK